MIVVGAGVVPARRRCRTRHEGGHLPAARPGNKVRQLHNDAAQRRPSTASTSTRRRARRPARLRDTTAENVTLQERPHRQRDRREGRAARRLEQHGLDERRVDNVDFHDVVPATADGIHNECIYAMAPGSDHPQLDVPQLRDDGPVGHPRRSGGASRAYGGITLENNVFAHSTNGRDPRWHYYGLLAPRRDGPAHERPDRQQHVRDPGRRRHRTTKSARASGVWANNVGGGWDCLSGMTYAGNVGKKCGASDVAVSPSSSCAPPACPSSSTMPVGWTNPAQFDFTLKAGSPAIGAASAGARAGARPPRLPARRQPRRRRLRVRRARRRRAGGTHPAGGSSPARAGGCAGRGLLPTTDLPRPAPRLPGVDQAAAAAGPPGQGDRAAQRLRKGAGPKLQRSLQLRGIRLHKAVRIRAAGLPSGRYRVLVRATDATGARSARRAAQAARALIRAAPRPIRTSRTSALSSDGPLSAVRACRRGPRRPACARRPRAARRPRRR